MSEWKDISRELVRRGEGIQGRVEKIDMVAAREKNLYIDKRVIVGNV